jgi:serine/threonine protein kinase
MNPSDPNSSASEAGRFTTLSLHAQGGIGSVYVARDAQLNRLVALKEIQPRFVDDRDSRDRFLREAEVTARLEHPGIVPVYGFGRYSDGRLYYAMRMILGKSLREAIVDLHQGRSSDQRTFELELRRLLNRFVTVCNTIEYAHSRSVLHRDLKPDNIMLGPFGETLVVDWGLAKLLSARPDDPEPLNENNLASEVAETSYPAPPSVTVSLGPERATQAGVIVGTLAFMSPE